jgi:phosphogluconate dehydratase
VKADQQAVTAPAAVFDTQEAFTEAFRAGKLNRDVVAVVRFQGPKANGMPELHSLSPALSVLQDRGFRVALVTDGRMSGASGKVASAIHVTPEAKDGGALAYLRDGDVVRLDPHAGVLEVQVAEAELRARPAATAPASKPGYGRELFGWMRQGAGSVEAGASVFFA